MADLIRLTGISATGHHGVLPHERLDGQTFVVDVTLHLDTRAAAADDRLAATVDYAAVAVQVREILAGPPVDLIETVAERIAAVVLADPRVSAVDVVVHKPEAPIPVPFTDVSVEIRRDRATPPVVPVPGVLDLSSAAAVPAVVAAPAPPDVPAAVPPSPAPAPSPAPVPMPTWAPLSASPEPAPLTPPVPVVPAVPPMASPMPMPVPPVPVPAVPALAAVPAVPAVPPVPTLADLVLPGVPDPSAPPSLPPVVGAGAGVDLVRTGEVPAFAADGPVDAPLDAAARPFDESMEALAAAGRGQHVAEPVPTDRMDAVPDGPVAAVLALGSNVGASQDTLRAAIRTLADVPGVEVSAVGPLARTAAVGGPEQPDFLNTVVLVTTVLSPRSLLHACLEIEAGLGRNRTEHWGPRTIDIDVVVHGATIGVTDDLELPHPRAHERAFVLLPWAQVDPGAVLPGLGGGPVAALAETAPDRDGVRWVNLDWWTAG